MEKIEEFLEDMRMEGKAEGTLREYKRRLERVQKLGIDNDSIPFRSQESWYDRTLRTICLG